MAEEKHPGDDGLTKECFEAYPTWTKRAFAIKIMNTLIPAQISRRLPKGLFPGLIGPGVIIPPGVILPPGTTIPPGYTVPPRWIPFTYFTLPEGQTWEQAFPEGWKAGDPLPDGVLCDTTVEIPEGWTPTNPPPNWFVPGGTGVRIPEGGVVPPLYLHPGLQSPPHPPHQQKTGEEVTEVTIYAANDRRLIKTGDTWALAWGATVSESCLAIAASGSTVAGVWRTATYNRITRGFLQVDLGEIAAGATITKVIFQAKTYYTPNGGASIQEGTQEDVVTVNDYAKFAGSLFTGQAWINGTNQFEFNTAGIAYMQSKIGAIAKLCIREYDHDYKNVGNDVGDDYRGGIFGSTNITDENRPQFILTYEN